MTEQFLTIVPARRRSQCPPPCIIFEAFPNGDCGAVNSLNSLKTQLYKGIRDSFASEHGAAYDRYAQRQRTNATD